MSKHSFKWTCICLFAVLAAAHPADASKGALSLFQALKRASSITFQVPTRRIVTSQVCRKSYDNSGGCSSAELVPPPGAEGAPQESQPVPTRRPRRRMQEGVDYRLNGNSVEFTKSYLERRGKCCGNGCVNCPYTGDQKIDHHR